MLRDVLTRFLGVSYLTVEELRIGLASLALERSVFSAPSCSMIGSEYLGCGTVGLSLPGDGVLLRDSSSSASGSFMPNCAWSSLSAWNMLAEQRSPNSISIDTSYV